MKGRKYTKKASGCCRWFLGDFSLFPSCLSTILSMFFFHNKFFFNPVHFILKKKALRENTLQSFYVLSRRVHNQTQYTCNALTIGKLPHGSYILYSLVGVTSDCLKQLKIVLKENGNGVTFFSRECHKIASSSNPRTHVQAEGTTDVSESCVHTYQAHADSCHQQQHWKSSSSVGMHPVLFLSH